MDKGALLWSRRFLAVGIILCFFRFSVGDVEYKSSDFGGALLLCSVAFLYDCPETRKSKSLLWSVIFIWTMIVFRSILSLSGLVDTMISLCADSSDLTFYGALVSAFLFCWAMMEVAESYHMVKSTKSWRYSMILSGFCYVVPTLAILICSQVFHLRVAFNLAVSFDTKTGFHIPDNVLFYVLSVAAYVPIVYIFVSYYRMLDDVVRLAKRPLLNEQPNMQDHNESQTNVL